MMEIAYVQRWIRARLAADSALTAIVGSRIFMNLAPQGTLRPFLVIDTVSSGDVIVVGAIRVLTHVRFTVKVAGRTVDDDPPFSVMTTVMNRVDALLHGASGGDAQIQVPMVLRETTFNYQDDQLYEHLGAQFFLEAYAT